MLICFLGSSNLIPLCFSGKSCLKVHRFFAIPQSSNSISGSPRQMAPPCSQRNRPFSLSLSLFLFPFYPLLSFRASDQLVTPFLFPLPPSFFLQLKAPGPLGGRRKKGKRKGIDLKVPERPPGGVLSVENLSGSTFQNACRAKRRNFSERNLLLDTST